MPAEIETMFYTSNQANERFVPWHGLGTPVEESPTSADALRLSGLDWIVEQKPVLVNNVEVERYKANVRNSDNSVLGIVSTKYNIVQNHEAFEFTDALIQQGKDEGIRYETAGSLKDGRTIWLLAKLPEKKILTDAIAPYLCFTNSHDGYGAIKACMTPIRVVCNNTLNIALDQATRTWSTKHMGNISSKLEEARYTLQLANTYMGKLADEAGRLANIRMSDDEIQKVLNELFPLDDDASDRQIHNINEIKSEILACCLSPDLVNFLNTKYGFINAIADWCTHASPARNTETYRSNNWNRIMNGHPIMDKAYALIK